MLSMLDSGVRSVSLRLFSLQYLTDTGLMEADLASDGAVTQTFSSKSKNDFAKLVLITMAVIGERQRCGGNCKAVEEMPSF